MLFRSRPKKFSGPLATAGAFLPEDELEGSAQSLIRAVESTGTRKYVLAWSLSLEADRDGSTRTARPRWVSSGVPELGEAPMPSRDSYSE